MTQITMDTLFDSPYSLASNTIKKICAPLFKNFNIKYFDYARFYKNNTCFVFFSEPNYVKFFLQAPAYLDPPPFLMPPGRYLWSGYIPPDFLADAAKEFSYCHGLTMIREQDNYKELCNVAASDRSALNFYLNKNETLDLFINYFISEVAPLINKYKKYRVFLPDSFKVQALVNDDASDSFLHEIQAVKKMRKGNCLYSLNEQLLSLSPREVTCLNLLKQGLSNKEIGNRLDLSYRTIEKFLFKIYEKAGVKNRYDLLKSFA